MQVGDPNFTEVLLRQKQNCPRKRFKWPTKLSAPKASRVLPEAGGPLS